MATDTPQIIAGSYATTAGHPFIGRINQLTAGNVGNWETQQLDQLIQQAETLTHTTRSTEEEEGDMPKETPRRIVRVFIVDPHEDVPLDKCLIFKGDEQLTDATNEELFFEIPITDLLKKHNEMRVKIELSDSAKDKPELLKPARIRDLKMVVVDLAQF